MRVHARQGGPAIASLAKTPGSMRAVTWDAFMPRFSRKAVEMSHSGAKLLSSSSLLLGKVVIWERFFINQLTWSLIMNLEDLKGAVADKTDVSKADASKMISAVFDSIQDSLTQGDKVAIPGFGTFEVADRPARQGRNPQTGATIEIAASKAREVQSRQGFERRFERLRTFSPFNRPGFGPPPFPTTR